MRKKRVSNKLLFFCCLVLLIVYTVSLISSTAQPVDSPLIIFEEHDDDDKAHTYALYLKACYQQIRGLHDKAFRTYQSILSEKHSTFVYEGFLNLLFDTGQFDAIAQLEAQKKEEFQKLFTNNLAIKLIFAQAYLYLGQEAKAEKLFTQLTEKYPNNEQVAYYSAVSYLKNRQFDRALTFLKGCLTRPALKSKYFLFHFLESKVYLQKGKQAAALAAIEKSLQLFPKFDQGWLFKGILLEQMGKINEAISGYKNFLDIAGRDAMVEKQLVQLLFSQKRFQEAETYLKQIKSDAPEYYFDRALIAFRAQHFQEALELVEKVLQKNQHFVKAKLLKIDILLAQEKVDDVLVFMGDWLVKEPENNSVLHTFLLLKKANISSDRLINVLDTVLKKKESLGILAVLADLNLEKREYAKSVSLYKKIVPLAKTDKLRSQVFFQMGYCYFALNKREKTEVILKQALDCKPAHPSAYNLLAYYYALINKNLSHALNLVDKALTLQPTRYDFLDTKGFIFLKLGKKEESIKVLEEAQKRAPFDKVIQKHLNEAKNLHNE